MLIIVIMPDYTKGKIYKIISDKANLCYIGSTCEKYLSNRMSGHRSSFKRFKNSKSKYYMTSFKVLEQDDAQIILIEKYPCECKYELEARERYWIEKLECCNKVIPTRTKQEFMKEYMKEYEQRPERKAKKKAWNQEREKTPERKAYMKAWHQKYDKRPERKAYRSEKLICELCGKQYTRAHKNRHQKSKYCQSFQTPEIPLGTDMGCLRMDGSGFECEVVSKNQYIKK